MADSDVLGIFSLLLAAGGAAYLLRARLLNRRAQLEAPPESEYPPSIPGSPSSSRSLPPGLPTHGFVSHAPHSPDSETERRKDTMPPSLRDISTREEQRRASGREQRVVAGNVSGPNKALLLNPDGSAKATLLSAGDDFAVKPIEKTSLKDSPAGKVSGTVEKDPPKSQDANTKTPPISTDEKKVAKAADNKDPKKDGAKRDGATTAEMPSTDANANAKDGKKKDADFANANAVANANAAANANAVANANAKKSDVANAKKTDGVANPLATPNPPTSGVESKSKPGGFLKEADTKPSAAIGTIDPKKQTSPTPPKTASTPGTKAVAPPVPSSSARHVAAKPAPQAPQPQQTKSVPLPAPISSSKLAAASNAGVPPAPPSSQPLPSSVNRLPSRIGKTTIVGTAKLLPEPEIPRIDVEEDEDVEPTKVGRVSPRAIQPLVEKAIFDEGADKEITLEEKAKKLVIYAVAQTDPGKRRKQNEDSHAVIEKLGLYVVADGMGGHRGGQYASKLAVETMSDAFEQSNFAAAAHADIPLPASELARAIQMSNAAILEEAKKKPELKGMGTTICALRFGKDARRLYVGHVGDSRCYRIRDGVMKQMTTDHTMADYGVAGPEGAHLSRALGVWPTVPIDVIMATPALNDLYLLCSDGLTKMLTNETIATQLLHEEDPKAAVERLVFFANAHGGKDNITVILLRVVESDWIAPVSKRQQSRPDT